MFDIEKVRTKMLIKYPYFGSVISNVEIIKKDSVKTAATDGKRIFYNLDFMNELDEEQQIFTIAHEVCHIVFKHPKKGKDKNHKLWNIATDAVINALLKKDNLKIIDGAIDMEGAEYYTAEELYNKLLEENYDEEVPSHSEHDLWNEENVDYEENISDMIEQEAFSKNIEQKKANLEDLRKKLIKEASSSSNKSDSVTFSLDNIGSSLNIIDWRVILKSFAKVNCDWSYKNPYIEYGIIKPRLEQIKSSETEILLDTSGSINDTLLRNFLRECKNIIKDSKIKIGCFDTEFYGFNTINTESDIDNIEFRGRGGTDFTVAVNSFSKTADNKIIFTDGCADMPEICTDIIWIVFGDEKINPKGGKVIYITGEYLDKLISKSRVK